MLLGCDSGPAARTVHDANDSGVPVDATAQDRQDVGYDTIADAAPDWSEERIASIACDRIKDEWETFISVSRRCDSETRCAIFEVWDDGGGRLTTCDRPPGLQASLNTDYLPIAQLFADRYFSHECYKPPFSDARDPNRPPPWSAFGWDGWPMQDPRCHESGLCTATIPSCFSPRPDAGPSADADADAGSDQ